MREMKDSGIEWIKQIPIEWKIMPNKYLMTKIKEINPVFNGEDILSLTMNGVIVRDLYAGGKMPTSFDGYQRVHKGNLLMCLFDIDVTPRCVGLIKNEGITSPAYSQFKCSDLADARYYNYYYMMLDNDKTLLHLSKNLRHSLTEDLLGMVPTVVPHLREQVYIADFLDEKCDEIDSLINDIQKQINIIEMYKKTVITEVMTKGLKKNVEMKDSGVEWIGKIPKVWKLTKLKYELKYPMKYGASESGVDFREELPRYIRITDITSDNKLKKDGKLSLTEEQAKGYVLNEDAILFARSGGTVGKSFLYKKEYGRAAFAGYLISAIPDNDKMIIEWLYYYTLSSVYWEWVNRIFTQATIQNIGADKFGNMPIVIPDIETQKKIIDIIEKKCTQMDDLLNSYKSQIYLLEQYKKSILYEYVTGKKEVGHNV